MVKAGLLHSFARCVIRSDKIRDGMQKSVSGQKYARLLQNAATDMTRALKAKDFEKLLSMEYFAVQRDFNIYGTDLAQKSEVGHKQIMERWYIGCDPEKAREDFCSSYAPENLSKAKIMDPIMESLIKTQCRRLSAYAKGNATPAEKLFFSRRQECLKAVYKEHMRHLEQALGLDKTRGNSKTLEL